MFGGQLVLGTATYGVIFAVEKGIMRAPMRAKRQSCYLNISHGIVRSKKRRCSHAIHKVDRFQTVSAPSHTTHYVADPRRNRSELHQPQKRWRAQKIAAGPREKKRLPYRTSESRGKPTNKSDRAFFCSLQETGTVIPFNEHPPPCNPWL